MTSPIDEFWPRPGGAATQTSQTHETQPILPPGEEPPPSGLNSDEQVPAAEADWQTRYEEQAKRTKIFMATTAAAVAALIGSLFFAFAAGSTAGAGSMSPAGVGGQFQGPGGTQLPGDGSQLPDGGMQGPGGMAPPGFGHHDGDGDMDGFRDFDGDSGQGDSAQGFSS